MKLPHIPVPCVAQLFEQPQTHGKLPHRSGFLCGRVEPPLIWVFSLKLALIGRHLFASGTVVRGGLVKLNHPKLMGNSPQAWFPVLHSGSNRFGSIEPPRTHANLPYRPCSLCSTVVRGGSVGLNDPEYLRNSPTGLLPCVVHWFEWVRRCRSIPNLCEIPCSLCGTVVGGGSVGLNHPELMRNCPTSLTPSVVQWFEQVRKCLCSTVV